eukprot:9685862-Lingulodinium_polyedra.AAC.1
MDVMARFFVARAHSDKPSVDARRDTWDNPSRRWDPLTGNRTCPPAHCLLEPLLPSCGCCAMA